MTCDIAIYHNPDCRTSRNTLAMIRNAGVELHVIEYLKTPPLTSNARKPDRPRRDLAARVAA